IERESAGTRWPSRALLFGVRVLLGVGLLLVAGCARASADAGDHGEVARLEPSGELSAMAVDPPRPEPDRDADAGVEGTAAGTEASGELAPGSGRACPREMAQVGPVCIDRWEAHLVARDSAGRLHQHPHNLRPPEAV